MCIRDSSQGPTAAIVPIKQLGTNGGGYFGCNSSHPLENPTYLTDIAAVSYTHLAHPLQG